ncbi:MAG: universal stress protein [Deltaproteobacteria bacterium]|nr:universal stress protein [Deltaproteobacteria bacterium]
MYQTILVPLDGSKRAETILPHVEEMAGRYGAKVVLLKVDEPEILLEWDEVIDMDKYKEERARQRKETESYLSSIQKKFRGKEIETQIFVKYSSLVIKEILSTAENVGADIIAMASHGQSGATRTFYGSIAAGVLSNIDRPLLLIRSRLVE